MNYSSFHVLKLAVGCILQNLVSCPCVSRSPWPSYRQTDAAFPLHCSRGRSDVPWWHFSSHPVFSLHVGWALCSMWVLRYVIDQSPFPPVYQRSATVCVMCVCVCMSVCVMCWRAARRGHIPRCGLFLSVITEPPALRVRLFLLLSGLSLRHGRGESSHQEEYGQRRG